MKFVSAFAAVLAFGFFAHAQENTLDLSSVTPSMNEGAITMPAAETQQMRVEAPTFGKENSNWNFNLGYSQFNQDFGTSTRKGSGITLELQRKFWDVFYVGGSYTNFNTDTQGIGSYSGQEFTSSSNADMIGLSLEAHVIRMPLPSHSEFFAAVEAGGVTSGPQTTPGANVIGSNPYYGAAIGLNISNQMGLRADIKSMRDYRAFNTLSLVGYY